MSIAGAKREDAAEESGAEGVDEGVRRKIAAQQRGKAGAYGDGNGCVGKAVQAEGDRRQFAEGQEEQLAEGSGEDGKAGAHEQGSSGETDEVQLETRCGGGFEQGKQGKDGNGAAKEVDGNGLQAW